VPPGKWLFAIVFACACKPTTHDQPIAAPPPGRASPPWPAAAEPAAPARFHWETLHHETIHARVLVPDGTAAVYSRDGYGYPSIAIAVGREQVTCQFDSGVGAMGVTLAKQPPTVYGLAVETSQLDGDHLAARYRDANGMLRISGFAPGVKCTDEVVGPLDDATRDDLYTVVASVRAAAPGPWRAATDDERAHGGMTDVPDGAWVERALPNTPGSMLRPGKFIASMHVGELVIQSGPCPASFDDERKLEAPEVEVQLEQRGDAWIRRTTEASSDVRYPGPTLVFQPHGARCCVADFIPWTQPPSAAKIDYAIALCSTFR
jgi:hypothetical protein